MKVCQTYEGMSNLWRYLKLMKVCQTYEGMLTLWRYANLMKACQPYEGLPTLWRHVKLMKVCHTYEGRKNASSTILLIKSDFILNKYLYRLHFSCYEKCRKKRLFLMSELSYPNFFACLSSLFWAKGLKSLEKVFWHYVCWRCILCFTGKNHPFSSWWLSFWDSVQSIEQEATVAFVVTEVDSIHSQQTCTKNYNQTVATFSQTYWPVTAAAIHIILLASNKQVGSVQDTLDVWGILL